MKTLEEIGKIRESKRQELDLRINKNSSSNEKHILVCCGTGCTSSKSPEIIKNFKKILEEKNIQNVRVIKTGCFGLCAKGPIVIIRPEDTFYSMVSPEDCEEIVETHIVKGERVQRLLCKDIDNKAVENLDQLSFYKKQKRIALKNCGLIDPECIDEYIAFDGYKALEKVLFEMTPDSVIEEISASGLRGRGGAGFPIQHNRTMIRLHCLNPSEIDHQILIAERGAALCKHHLVIACRTHFFHHKTHRFGRHELSFFHIDNFSCFGCSQQQRSLTTHKGWYLNHIGNFCRHLRLFFHVNISNYRHL